MLEKIFQFKTNLQVNKNDAIREKIFVLEGIDNIGKDF